MIGYVILLKQVNPETEGGFDYAMRSDVILDPATAAYALSGFASPSSEGETLVIAEIDREIIA